MGGDHGFGRANLRLAIGLNDHLLVQSRVKTVDRDSRERQEDVTIYTNFLPKDGVQMAMQVTHERDLRRIRQAFYENCTVNPDLPVDFFTKASLEKRFGEVGGRRSRTREMRSRLVGISSSRPTEYIYLVNSISVSNYRWKKKLARVGSPSQA